MKIVSLLPAIGPSPSAASVTTSIHRHNRTHTFSPYTPLQFSFASCESIRDSRQENELTSGVL